MLTKPNISENISENFEGVALSPTIKELQKYDFIATIGYDDHSISIYDHAFEVHKQHNAPGTFYVTTGRIESQDRSFGLDTPSQWGDTCTWEQLREMNNSPVGTITVANHTHSHPTMNSLTKEELHEELSVSQGIFKREGFNPKYLSYPYGATNNLSIQYVRAYFEGARGTTGAISNADTNMYNTAALGIDSVSISSVKSKINEAKQVNGWLDLYMHAVYPGSVTDVGSTCKSPEELSEIMQYIKDQNGVILSFDDAFNIYMKNFQWTKHNILQAKL